MPTKSDKPERLAKDIVVQVYKKPPPRKDGKGGAFVSSARITRTPRTDAATAKARIEEQRAKAAASGDGPAEPAAKATSDKDKSA